MIFDSTASRYNLRGERCRPKIGLSFTRTDASRTLTVMITDVPQTLSAVIVYVPADSAE